MTSFRGPTKAKAKKEVTINTILEWAGTSFGIHDLDFAMKSLFRLAV